jgi:hypothetical protein
MVTAIGVVGVAGADGEEEGLVAEAAVEEALVVEGALELLLEAGAAEELCREVEPCRELGVERTEVAPAPALC